MLLFHFSSQVFHFFVSMSCHGERFIEVYSRSISIPFWSVGLFWWVSTAVTNTLISYGARNEDIGSCLASWLLIGWHKYHWGSWSVLLDQWRVRDGSECTVLVWCHPWWSHERLLGWRRWLHQRWGHLWRWWTICIPWGWSRGTLPRVGLMVLCVPQGWVHGLMRTLGVGTWPHTLE